MNKTWISVSVAAVAVGLIGSQADTAAAATLRVVDVNDTYTHGVFSGPDGTFEKLVPVSPGTYGLEARGGRQGARDWEIGVGTQTSHAGTFSENKYFDDDWGDGSTLHDLMMTWMPGEKVQVTIGDTTVSYEADWQVGNGIEILAKRSALFTLTELDGMAFNETVGEIGSNAGHTPLFLAGDSLLDGWILKGQIAMTAGGGSRNTVMITPGTFTPSDTASVPEPTSLLGLMALGALATGGRLKAILNRS
ncbi:MAG: PEP-CTERM sorting domain-containing protein [Leptolyngbya sp. SIO1E4]|nr:PEP-CTERM sorting domain-containing protein [Leptolyngbya sp. SIO1E4]